MNIFLVYKLEMICLKGTYRTETKCWMQVIKVIKIVITYLYILKNKDLLSLVYNVERSEFHPLPHHNLNIV